jgi:hypothetical protein
VIGIVILFQRVVKTSEALFRRACVTVDATMLQQHSTNMCTIGALVLLFLLPACSEEPAEPSFEPPVDARITLGAGRVNFVAIEEGDPVELVSGPQGGFHLEFTLRLFNGDPEGLVLDYRVYERQSAKQLSFPARYVIGKGYVLDKGDHFLRVGDRSILDVGSAMQAQGLQVDASCRIEHAGIVIAEDQKTLTIIDEVDELAL